LPPPTAFQGALSSAGLPLRTMHHKKVMVVMVISQSNGDIGSTGDV
jgi:hypothetical protein